MAGKQPLRQGEKILFGMVIAFVAMAVVSYVILEVIRYRSTKPMYAVTTHFDLSAAGQRGSQLFRTSRCTSCHRAMRNGTNMGLSLDAEGSRHDVAWIYAFLTDPEKTYGAATVDHGAAPKEAAHVMYMDQGELMAIATFLSELRSDQGSASAPMPPAGKSEFIDSMVKTFAPDDWKDKYSDVRDPGQQPASIPKEVTGSEQ
ncbi:MAG: c-type cytochrome [Gammaproteobacteria bacterium]|nr:c-type cytochrome [Gammaproteobacteria bacterium]